jgi:BirA family transcriptional regulator, biotin operon repressor / biotin---[acetyl-CoA-carboxylase] ligase
VFDSLPSTNAAALAATHAPVWIMAHMQTAGRGRRARAWDSPRGNLYASLRLHPAEPPQQMALRSFVAALALRDALLTVGTSGADVALKWPNDVLLKRRKVAGILLEAATTARGLGLVIGFGVNLATCPDAAHVEMGATPPTSLIQETGLAIAPEDFLPHLAAAYAAREAAFTAHGFAPIRGDFLAHAARLGAPITARLAGGAVHSGLFQTIDANGHLVMDTEGGQITIPAADVYFTGAGDVTGD